MTTPRNRTRSTLEATAAPVGQAPSLLAQRVESREPPAAVAEDAEGRGRAPRISRDDVYAAADALLVDGHRPTIDRVRMKLGRGSPNTINDHLDAWWQKLGSRLRDLPGREFPQLPEAVAATLQQLWNEALEGAHESLHSALERREGTLTERETQLAGVEARLQEDARAAQSRASGLEEALALARAQLTEANRRAMTLEGTLTAHEAERTRVRARLEQLETSLTATRGALDRERAAAATERARAEERHELTEKRWIGEVDRARQEVKARAQSLRELQKQLDQGQRERDQLSKDLLRAREELATATAARQALEKRLRTPGSAPTTPARSRNTSRTRVRAAGVRRPPRTSRPSRSKKPDAP